MIKDKMTDSNSKGLADAPDKFSGAKQYDHDMLEKFSVEEVKGSGTESQDSEAKLVARVHTDSGCGFYDARGENVLPAKYQLLKNEMYPYNGEFDFNFYLSKEEGRNRLYYIDASGIVDLGQVVDAIPLSKDLVAVCRRGAFYGIIDKAGNMVLDANKYGRILGINKNGFKVCEVEKDICGLVDDQGKIVDDKQQFDEYIVNPLSNILCGIKKKGDSINEIHIINVGEEIKCDIAYVADSGCPITKVYVYNEAVVAECSSKSGKSTNALLIDVSKYNHYSYYQKVSVNQLESWKGRYYIGHGDSYELSSPLHDLKAKFVGFKNHILVLSRKNNYMINNDNHRYEKVLVSCKNDAFVAAESHAIIFGMVKDAQIETKRLKEYNNDFKVGIDDSITLGSYMVIRYWKQREKQKKLDHTIIVDSQGEIIKEDLFDQFKFLSGPIHDDYFYLEDGEIVKMHEGETEGKKLSDGLQAEMMWPLGLTGRFLIKKNDECQIVDSSGTLHGQPFSIGSDVDMDSVCNSKYIPIVNAEGKFGRVDTNGNVIVPCKYDKVEDLDASF